MSRYNERPPASPLWLLALFALVFVFGMAVGARLAIS